MIPFLFQTFSKELLLAFLFFSYSRALAVPFFSSMESPFPSGESSLARLEERIISQEFQLQYRIKWDEKEFVQAKQNLIFDFEVSDEIETLSESPLFEEPRDNSPMQTRISSGQKAAVLMTRGHWLRIGFSGTKGWIHSKYIRPSPQEKGFFRAFVEAPLRRLPHDFSARVATLPPLTPVRPLEFKRGWVKVHWGSFKGYVSLRYLIGKSDFADRVRTSKGWNSVRHRHEDQLITADNSTLALSDIQEMNTDRDRAFVVAPVSSSKGPRVGSRVKVLNVRGDLWYKSLLAGHGPVWWSKNSSKKNSANDGTDELLRKYENREYPGLTTPEGVHFIGQYRSKDGGKNFEPFIRWEHVAGLVREKYKVEPQFFKILKIEPMTQSRVKMTVDVGRTKVKLVSHVHGHEIRVLK